MIKTTHTRANSKVVGDWIRRRIIPIYHAWQNQTCGKFTRQEFKAINWKILSGLLSQKHF